MHRVPTPSASASKHALNASTKTPLPARSTQAPALHSAVPEVAPVGASGVVDIEADAIAEVALLVALESIEGFGSDEFVGRAEARAEAPAASSTDAGDARLKAGVPGADEALAALGATSTPPIAGP